MKKFEIIYKDGTREEVKALSQYMAIYNANISLHKIVVSIKEIN